MPVRASASATSAPTLPAPMTPIRRRASSAWVAGPQAEIVRRCSASLAVGGG